MPKAIEIPGPPEVVRIATVSTVEAAANAIRDLILDGELPAGTRLRENDFAERLGVARHSFRAATQILIGDGLLRREPNRGVQVPVFSQADVEDIFKLRAALEVEATRLVIEADVVPIEARGAVATLSALSADAAWSDVVQPDLTFHRAVIDAAGSERLQRAYHGLQSEIVLCMVQLQPAYDHPAEVAAEHEELLAAIEARDVDNAERLWRIHLDEAAANQIKALAATDTPTSEEDAA
ncbi:MAG TPA: GntR family transcriptional regulator [Solirubrobacterales bacterium]|jgi:DNA-binding GntR family transcriptional regulator|nr:GntR family transcriptional regulator [Solirubrobacterales bacterium]